MMKLKTRSDFKQTFTSVVGQVVRLGSVLIDTARMQELWMCVDMRGFCIGAAYGPLLLIHSVLSSVPTEAWADPHSDGMCGSPLRGGADFGGRALLRTIEYMHRSRL